MKNVGNSSRGRRQGVSKIQGIHIAYRAHRAVIFATAQLSCCPSCYNAVNPVTYPIHILRTYRCRRHMAKLVKAQRGT